MKKPQMYIVILVVSLILSLIAYHYLISIYEVTISVNPKILYTNSQSAVTTSVIPINALGKKAWFRKAYTDFDITEGKDLVDIVSINNKNGELTLRARNKPGMVVVNVKSRYALFPSSIEIPVYPDLAENIK